jgi:hypothetical protein
VGGLRNAYNILVVKPEEKRPVRRPRRRWKGNISMDIRNRVGGYWLDAYGSG